MAKLYFSSLIILSFIFSINAQNRTTELKELVISNNKTTVITPVTKAKYINNLTLSSKNSHIIEVVFDKKYHNKYLTKIKIPYQNYKFLIEPITKDDERNQKIILQILDESFNVNFVSDTLEFNNGSRKLKYLEVTLPDLYLVTEKPLKLNLQSIESDGYNSSIMLTQLFNYSATEYNTKIYGFGTNKKYSFRELYTNPSLSMKTDYLINLGFEFEDGKIE
nr:hypothetical protein [uncultured Flavobacterium sp.]